MSQFVVNSNEISIKPIKSQHKSDYVIVIDDATPNKDDTDTLAGEQSSIYNIDQARAD